MATSITIISKLVLVNLHIYYCNIIDVFVIASIFFNLFAEIVDISLFRPGSGVCRLPGHRVTNASVVVLGNHILLHDSSDRPRLSGSSEIHLT